MNVMMKKLFDKDGNMSCVVYEQGHFEKPIVVLPSLDFKRLVDQYNTLIIPELKQMVITSWRLEGKIFAIKEYKKSVGCGLREAKEICEAFWNEV